jgi:predicted nucleic acid-binding protein
MFSGAWEKSSLAGIVFDTSVYISALRQGDASIFSSRRASRKGEITDRPLWLSAVVLEELYVGARDEKLKKLLARLEKDFERAGRLLVPLQSDWTACGQVLARVGERYGYEQVGRARLTNDALIAMSAARCGFTILTLNAADFKKIAEFRPLQWEEA